MTVAENILVPPVSELERVGIANHLTEFVMVVCWSCSMVLYSHGKCAGCDKEYPRPAGYSPHFPISDGSDRMKEWISAWLSIPTEDIEVSIDD